MMRNKYLAVLLIGACPTVSRAASGIHVTVTQRNVKDAIVCRYELVNNGSQPIVTFAVGGNEGMAGPYELMAAPDGFDPDQGGSPMLTLADGWDESLLTQPGDLTFGVEWETKEYENGVMPQKKKAFELRFTTPKVDCGTGHWTVISRDSQIISGLLKE